MIHLKDKLTIVTHGSLFVKTKFPMNSLLFAIFQVMLISHLCYLWTRTCFKELIISIRTKILWFQKNCSIKSSIMKLYSFIVKKKHPEPEPPTSNLAKYSCSPQKSFRPKPPSHACPLLPNHSHISKLIPLNGFNPTSNPITCQY